MGAMLRGLGLLLVVCGVGAACSDDRATISAKDRPECGHDWPDSVKISVIAPIADIPEFHDCQRFVVKGPNDARAFGPLAAIFATTALPFLEARLSEPVPVRGNNTTTTAAPAVPPPGAPRQSVAVNIAVIYADDVYTPLGMQVGLNCLYLFYDTAGGADTTWSARLAPEGMVKNCPTQAPTALAPYKELEVRRQVVMDPTSGTRFADDADYPPVARWDIDAAKTEYYISIECGKAWCEIGANGFTSSPPLALEPGDHRDEARVKLIKGWYDQQYLATWDPATKVLSPSGVVGTLIPDPKLGSYNNEAAWKRVAQVMLTSTNAADVPTLDRYEAKYGFKKNESGKWHDIKIKAKGPPTGMEDLFEGRIDPPGAGGAPKLKNVKYRPTGTIDPPGVVRWRWLKDDEGVWSRCKLGCCEISTF